MNLKGGGVSSNVKLKGPRFQICALAFFIYHFLWPISKNVVVLSRQNDETWQIDALALKFSAKTVSFFYILVVLLLSYYKKRTGVCLIRRLRAWDATAAAGAPLGEPMSCVPCSCCRRAIRHANGSAAAVSAQLGAPTHHRCVTR